MTEVTDTATGFESLITPRIRVSGTTDGAGTVTEAQVTYKAADVEGGREIDAQFAFSTLVAVVGLSLTEDQASNALTELGWPSREEGLVFIDVDGVIGGVRYIAQDEGPVGIVMTAVPAD